MELAQGGTGGGIVMVGCMCVGMIHNKGWDLIWLVVGEAKSTIEREMNGWWFVTRLPQVGTFPTEEPVYLECNRKSLSCTPT